MPKFRTLTGQFAAYIQDGPDPDITPDRLPMDGTVTFTPVYTGGVIAFPNLVPPEFARPETIRAKIVGGETFVEVASGTEEPPTLQPLSLMVTVDDEATQTWSWRAEFSNMRVFGGNGELSIPAWSFRVPDGTGPVDLTELVPLKSSGTVDVTKGPRGAGLQTITAVDGQLVFEYTDGQESTVPIPEAVQGPEGPQGPAGADGEQGPQGEKGDPGEIPDLLVGNITDATPTGKNLMLAATEGAARNALGLQTGATASSGSLEELSTGTSNTARVWNSRDINDFVAGKADAARASYSIIEFGADPTGAVGSTTEILATISAAKASGKSVLVPPGSYLLDTSLGIPSGSTIHFDNATFIGTTNYEFLSFDSEDITATGHLTVTRSGVVANPRAVRIAGTGVSIQSLAVESPAPGEGAASGNENAVGVNAATNVHIGNLSVKNYEHAIRVQNSSEVKIGGGTVESYRRGMYINSSKGVDVDGMVFHTGSPSATAAAGHNAILAESTNGHGSASDIRLSNIRISDSGEHGIRFGGQQKIRNVWMSNIQITNAGGCGVKILGGSQASANYHENFFLRGILVVDCGSLNAAMAGVMIQFAKNVSLSDYQAVAVNNTYSCGAGIEMQAVDGVQIVNPIIRDTSVAGIELDFVLGNIRDVLVSGGVASVAAGVGVSIDYTNRAFSNVRFRGLTVEATTSDAKCAKIVMNSGTPTVSSCSLGFSTSTDSGRVFDTGAGTVYSDWKAEIEAPFVSVGFRDGSTWTDWATGVSRIRKSGSWATL